MVDCLVVPTTFEHIQKSKLVLVGPDGYVTKHGAQLPINTAGFYIRGFLLSRSLSSYPSESRLLPALTFTLSYYIDRISVFLVVLFATRSPYTS